MIKFNEEHKMTRKMAKEFAAKEMAPIASELDEKEEFALEVFKKMAKLNFLGLPYDEKYGGAGMDYISYTITLEEFARACASTALSYSAHVSLALAPIYHFGNETQKEKFLPALISGKKIGAFGLTEPMAGSDPGSAKTTAVRKGDHYILNGSKVFITNAAYADTFVVSAVTDQSLGKKGISAFILEKEMPGFEIGKHEKKLGMRASPTSMLHFTDVKISAENLLGEENNGFKIFLNTLNAGRVGIAAQALGIAKESMKRAMNYAQEREQFNKKIGEFQAIQFKIADMATKIYAAEQMVYSAAQLMMDGKPYIYEAGMAKLFATEAATEIANEAIQIHGGYGYTKEYEVERFWRDAKLLEIGEGTSEIQRMVIYREVLKGIDKL
jgi:alkylation response protein AidB-like acyl-CoA dehydrogenase